MQIAKGGKESDLEVTIFIWTTEFSIFFEVCPCAEQARLICYPAYWRRMWKCKYCINEMLDPAQACILLIVSIPALEFNICFSWTFLPRKHNSSKVNVQLKHFLNSNVLKWSLSLSPISILLFLQQNYFFFCTKPIFCDQREFFWCYFAARSCQVNVLVAFLIIIEIPVAKCYLICSGKATHLCICI